MKTSGRTMAHLTKLGILSDLIERYNQFTKQRHDLFNIIDIIALFPDGVAGIQACGSDFASHDRKILETDESLAWIMAGGVLELWSWRKLKVKRGGKAVRWTPRVKRYDVKDFK